jgi:putative NADPH-quinone reductase
MIPALFKAFYEQVFRPGFALAYGQPGRVPKKLLSGRTARIVVTMGMPALYYRWYFGAHGLKSLKHSVLTFSGIRPVKETLVGMVDAMHDAKRAGWLEKLRALGRQGK